MGDSTFPSTKQVSNLLPLTSLVLVPLWGLTRDFRKLNETLKDLDAPNWEELFDKTSIFKFLYILQIVDGLMSPKGTLCRV